MENTDTAFDPCVDFHRHACGRWFAGSTARRSYVDENRANFSAAAHGALTQLLLRPQPGGGDIPHDDVGMARFYASCLAYARKRPITRVPDLLERMSLNKSSWTDFTSSQQLFDHVLAANFRTGLAGLVRVSKDESAANGLLVVDVGESLQSTLGDHTAWFLSMTLRELDWPKNRSLIAALQSLDARVERARSQVNDSLPLDATSVGENAAFLGLGLSWEDALEHAFSSASNESSNLTNAVVNIGAVDALKGMLAALTTTDLRVAGLYSLLLMLAQVMRYPYLLATNYAGFEDVTLCLQAVSSTKAASRTPRRPKRKRPTATTSWPTSCWRARRPHRRAFAPAALPRLCGRS
ncbi:uncharacterized protein LOC119456933 [Dermacentor silvarum]|uniref:uncharacterized protein LOC119456933 n=1 Tax=Dermacentor silvarum TaxID=543639 RepID=UPI002100D456|nr:uncharacterized protein LOC119456933 [Dermacentor silvarum]